MTARHEIPLDGERVVAVHHEAGGDDWLVFCHGLRSDKSGSYESRCRRAVQEGYDAVRFDFRGCGESSRSVGEQTLSSRLADLRAVLAYFEPPSYVLFGSSFGGKVALHHGGDDRCPAIAVRAPVTYNRALDPYRPSTDSGEASHDDAGASSRSDETGVLPGGFFDDLATYPFSEVTETLAVPVGIFHGRDDASVPVEDSLAAVGELTGDVFLQCYADEGHLFSRLAEARLREQLFDWLATVRDDER